MNAASALMGPPTTVVLPDGRPVDYWDCPGPLGAPTLLLLHGVTLTARLNWSSVVPRLTPHYRVIALDHFDPGQRGNVRLEDCADDAAALLRALGIDRVIPVGYSMGGMIAQLMWHRHREHTSGLVLCATSRNVSGSPWEHVAAQLMPGLLAAAMWVPPLHLLRADVVGTGLLDAQTPPAARVWARAEMRRTPLLAALSALRAASQFSSHKWIGAVDVPTAVVIPRQDRIVPPRRQWKLAAAVPGSTVYEVDGDHGMFLHAPGAFATALLAACESVCAVTYDGDEPLAS
jgi:pimeloyl-ACP methyl ester carboxylesterase